LIVAGGAETMSMINMGGWRLVPNPDVAKTNPGWYLSMGLTSEMVAREYDLKREDLDEFSANSYAKAYNAIDTGYFKNQIVPYTVKENYVVDGKIKTREKIFDVDECPRRGTTKAALARLRPAFAADGISTAGNSSQMSDGAAFVLVVSEKILKRHNLTPIARLVDYQVAGVDPYKMGIGPIKAIPKVLKHAGMKLDDMDLIELNEAFATQSMVVVKETGINPDILNVNGGAISLGHPLGCTGAKLTVQILNELKRRNKKYGMVTMCIGTGQGAAGIYEML